jgi:hypothetical protein
MQAKDLWMNFPPFHGDIPDEDKWRLIRKKRNKLLAESDWSQLVDSPVVSTKKDWISYRTKLRNIPQDYKNPDDVIFPDPPKSNK